MREVIIAAAPNFKMAPLHFENVTQQMTNVIRENQILKSAKDASEISLLKSSGNWLIFMQVIQTIVTEFTSFNLQNTVTTI